MTAQTSAGAFSGFPDQTLAFLQGLAANNEKAWFDAHRGDYEAFYVRPALAFVEALGPQLQAVDPAVRYEARVNGSLFRIQRDIRFSKDKTPYKTNLDLWFWTGERKGWDNPGFFFRLAPDHLILGAGLHQFGPEAVKAFREAVIDLERGPQLAELMRQIEAGGTFTVGREARKTVPRGFDPGHERARFLRFDGLHAESHTPIPAEAATPIFVEYCLERFRALNPVNLWLRETLRPA